MSIDEFLSNLERRGVRIWADGESLRYDAPSELITADFLTELRERKGDLLAFLHGAERMSGAQLAPIPKSPILIFRL